MGLKVILANVQAMQRTLTDMETCRGELRLPQGGEENLTVFSRAQLVRQQLHELQQASVLEVHDCHELLYPQLCSLHVAFQAAFLWPV